MKHSFIKATDGYKFDHRRQYPLDTEFVLANWTPRAARDPFHDRIVWCGAQAVVQYLFHELANETFFSEPRHKVLRDYQRRLDSYFGENDIGTNHIGELHELGYIPLDIRTLAEGTHVPHGVPCMTIENTLPEFFWLTNYVETPVSNMLWQPSTSAATAYRYRKLLDGWAKRTGGDPAFVDYQGHDFSFRGMPGLDAAALSGMGHALFFSGTDTHPAIDLIEDYYDDEPLLVSVPATEHSVMCADGETNELETFRRMLRLYPKGVVSVVSDTWDLWRVCTEYLPAMKDEILARPGKLVIRPDSGDPELILCGDPKAPAGSPQRKGVVELLWDVFGGMKNAQGYRELDGHIGTIYGDSITEERADRISGRLFQKLFASTNVVFGIGSYTYQYVTRDVHGWAMKATWNYNRKKGEVMMQKSPVTDSGTKRSARGRVAVIKQDGRLTLVDNLDFDAWLALEQSNQLKPLFRDGEFMRRERWRDMKDRAMQPLRVAA
jgi:nicotinamide phosphoribosyltransferase